MGPLRLSSGRPSPGPGVDGPAVICILSGLLGGLRARERFFPALAPSSRGLGHGPFKAATRVRIPSGSILHVWLIFPIRPRVHQIVCATSPSLVLRSSILSVALRRNQSADSFPAK